MSLKQHLVRITLLMTAALALLTWLAAHTEVMFADGLRYIALAQAIDQVRPICCFVDHGCQQRQRRLLPGWSKENQTESESWDD